MGSRWITSAGAIVFAVALNVPAVRGQQPPAPRTAAPVRPEDLPQKKTPAVPRPGRGGKPYTPPRTPWGDPAIAGVFTNNDESGIPFERPSQFDGRKPEDITSEELAALVRQRQQQTIERAPTLSEFPGATSPLHWFENYNAANSRAWLVTDPPDGHVPPNTSEAQARNAARTRARQARGPADSYEDRSLYDRCITRGIPGSMMPAIYGNAYQIHQGPGFVAIRYEMVNETRIIPLDGRAAVGPKIQQWFGDSRGHWEGATLVVETVNQKVPFRGSDQNLHLIERFTRTDANTIEYRFTVDDPTVWTQPWTASYPMRRTDLGFFEYACHEGNERSMVGTLKTSRMDDSLQK